MNNTKIFEGQSGSELLGMAFKYIISHCMQELTYNTYTSHSSRKAQKDRSVAFFMKYLARSEENWLSVLWSDEATFANTAHREIKKTSVKRGGVLKRGSTYAFSFHCTMGDWLGSLSLSALPARCDDGGLPHTFYVHNIT